jgi:hypothetical protein
MKAAPVSRAELKELRRQVELSQPGALLALMRLHTPQDVVEEANRADDVPPDAILFLSGGIASAQQHGAPLPGNSVQEIFQNLSD